jgi:hypothetical protein
MKISTICFALLTFVSRLQAGEPGHLYELQTNDLKESRTLATTLAGGKVSFGDESLPIANLVSLRVPKVPLPPLPAESHIVLANGDRIAGDIIGGDGLSLRFAANFGSAKPVELTLPLSAVSAIWFVSPPQDHPLDAGKYPWVDASKKSDTLRLRNGDGIRGTLERFAPAGGPLRFKPAGEATAKPFEPNTIAALAFDPSLSRMKVPAGQHFRIVARSGSRITLSAASFDGKVFSGTTVTGVKFAMPQEDLLALDTVGGKVGYLADLKPKEQKSTVSYDLSGKYRSFRATVGLDRLSGRKGAVDVRVLLDGKEQAIPGLKGLTADGAVEVRLDVSGAKLLTVIVEFGAGGDIGDDVNWVGAKLAE